MANNTNLRTTPVPTLGSEDMAREITVVAMNTHNGTMYPGQTTRRGRRINHARQASARRISAAAIETSTAIALAAMRPKIHGSLWGMRRILFDVGHHWDIKRFGGTR